MYAWHWVICKFVSITEQEHGWCAARGAWGLQTDCVFGKHTAISAQSKGASAYHRHRALLQQHRHCPKSQSHLPCHPVAELLPLPQPLTCQLARPLQLLLRPCKHWGEWMAFPGGKKARQRQRRD